MEDRPKGYGLGSPLEGRAGSASAPKSSWTTVELGPLRVLAAAGLGVAALWPLLPVHPLPACPLLASTGIPCPSCGMTRSVVALTHGDLGASAAFNPGGILLVGAAVALLLAWRVRAVRMPRWTPAPVLALLWVWNLTFNPTFT